MNELQKAGFSYTIETVNRRTGEVVERETAHLSLIHI